MLGIIVVPTSAHDLRLCTRIDGKCNVAITSFMIMIPVGRIQEGGKLYGCAWRRRGGREVELCSGGSGGGARPLRVCVGGGEDKAY